MNKLVIDLKYVAMSAVSLTIWHGLVLSERKKAQLKKMPPNDPAEGHFLVSNGRVVVFVGGAIPGPGEPAL